MVIKIVSEESRLMGSANASCDSSSPHRRHALGLQGSGKTTNGAKRRIYAQAPLQAPLLAACDIYRPRIQQLDTVGRQLDIPGFQMGTATPDIAKAAVAHAVKHGNDIVFLDTAGRLHIDEALMDELRNIKSAVKPTEILLVVDAMTGQDAVNAATAFNDALGVDGIILTKLDGDARGGAALSVRAVTGKPVKFAGSREARPLEP
jgi:signal recognition particle subunit SRP54